ncbi:MAG: hypothetical protein JXA99_04955 [Candidatus Lokiarchaeota archaeon]|nr:hypothetical protein [Candidatus Lokiarchaeota archaeon]
MEINWIPTAISDFIVSFICIIGTIIILKKSKIRHLKSIFFFKLTLLFMSFYSLSNGLADLFMYELYKQFHGIFLFMLSVFLIIGINYIRKETFLSYLLLIVFGFGFLLISLSFTPGNIQSAIESGFHRIIWKNELSIVGTLIEIITTSYLFYYGLKTLQNVPILIRKDGLLFFFSIFTIFPLSIIVYLFFNISPYNIIISNFFFSIGMLIFIISISREPKLLYILPFTLYRILVKDREGYPLFDHDWAESNINETLFTGFINSVQIMSEEVMKVGGLLDINLSEGILVLHELDYITIGLVASKSSRLLKDSLVNFSNEFQDRFQRELKQSDRDKNTYFSAYELIDKYFSNFPYKFVKSRRDPLFLINKQKQIPIALDNKLKEIFKDEKDYNIKIQELLKNPYGISTSFFDLYDELKEKYKLKLGEDNK